MPPTLHSFAGIPSKAILWHRLQLVTTETIRTVEKPGRPSLATEPKKGRPIVAEFEEWDRLAHRLLIQHCRSIGIQFP